MTPPIGISTGWLFAENIEKFNEQQKLINLVGSAELSITSKERTKMYDMPIENLDYLSYHLPTSDELIQQHRQLHKKHDIDTAVIHPTTEKYIIESYINSGLPVSIENMDINKNTAQTATEVYEYISEYNVPLTLDIQHAYEIDNTMNEAWKLIDMVDDIAELHVSGESKNLNHELIHKSQNKDILQSFLKEYYKSHNTPIIIEGKYTCKDDIKKEREFLINCIQS